LCFSEREIDALRVAADRKSDGAAIFKIDRVRYANYWREQAFPVLPVIRDSQGVTLWMDVREYLRRQNDSRKKRVTQIVFVGERFGERPSLAGGGVDGTAAIK
jgi:hypothetical protein